MIIHRAYIREVLQTCAAVTAILFSIFLVTRLVGFLSAATEGDIAMDSVLLLLVLKMMTYLDVILPLVVYISIILVMGRWIRDNELTVISACGIGMGQFILPTVFLFLVLGTVVGAFSLYISPLSAEAGHAIEFEYRNRSDATGIVPGVFTETRRGNGVYFVESYDAKTDTFRDIFVYNSSAGDDSVVVAASGYKMVDEKTNDDFLILENGNQYKSDGNQEYTVGEFETYALRLAQHTTRKRHLPTRAVPTFSLLEQPLPRTIAEFHWRFSKVAALLVLMLFALSFSSISYRKARFPGMLAALLIYFTYTNLLGLGVAMIRRQAAPPHLTLWAINIIFFMLALYLFNRRRRNLRLLPGLKT